MNNLIDKYLTLLDDASRMFPEPVWYWTSLSSKNRFDLNNRNLIKKIYETDSENVEFLANEMGLKKGTTLNKLWAIGALSKTFLSVFRRAITYQKPPYWDSLLKNKKKIILIKSFFFDRDFKRNQKEDFDGYFGRLPYLINDDETQVVVLSDCVGDDKLLSRYEDPRVGFVSTYSLVSPFDVVKAMVLVLKKGLFSSSWVSLQVLKNTTFVNSLYEIIFDKILNELSVKKILYTYENNPWEKTLIQKARKYRVPSYGFQHVPFAPSALNYFFTKREVEECLPDHIVTTGEVPAEILVNKYSIPREKIINGYGFRFRALEYRPVKPKKGNRILVGLEGVGNCSFLINYILNHNDFFKEGGYEITLRFHPAFKLNKMASFIKDPALLSQPHVKVSKQSLQEDFEQNDILLYWGSTVSFEALGYGLWLINLNPQDELFSNDQLWNYSSSRLTAEEDISPKELFSRLNDLRNSNLNGEGSLQKKGQEYLKNYLRPWDDDFLKGWIFKNLKS
ncbi:MAG: hypothetical protein NXH75_04950 [Halobacteriovoraceae bacterium]|nr:hypothetical protein [Halobacteriovoraceae bacterium]